MTKHDPEIKAAKLTGLALLREPFPAHQISKLPKPTAAQTKAVRDDFKTGIRCKLCGAWHHKEVVHLDYVGHAALTDRLLDCDPHWNWEPLGLNPNGLPIIDGGLWIKLTVCNVTRLGFGNADGKSGGDAIKELIGDALRNAAMRFGAALDLWHKGDLHADEEPEAAPVKASPQKQDSKPVTTDENRCQWLKTTMSKAKTRSELQSWWTRESIAAACAALPDDMRMDLDAEYGRIFDAMQPNADLDQDEIPY